MKLRSVTYALLIAGVATFSTSSLAAQSLRFGYETSQTDSQHIAAKKFNELLQEKTKGELKLKLFPDSTLGNAQAMISGVRGGRPLGTRTRLATGGVRAGARTRTRRAGSGSEGAEREDLARRGRLTQARQTLVRRLRGQRLYYCAKAMGDLRRGKQAVTI